MVLRPYSQADQSRIEAIQNESQEDIDPSVPVDYFDDLIDIDQAFSDGAFLICEVNGTVAGYGGLRPDGEIVRMRVSSEFRRRGFASEILGGLIQAARRQSLARVYLHTLAEQTAAQALYLDFGFIEKDRGTLHGNAVVLYEYAIS